LHHKNKENFKF